MIGNERQHPTQERLEDQIGWYDRRSQTAQRRYKALKLAQVIIAALIPLASAFQSQGRTYASAESAEKGLGDCSPTVLKGLSGGNTQVDIHAGTSVGKQ